VLESRAQEDIPIFNRMVLTTPVGAKVALKHAGRPAEDLAPHHHQAEPNEAREVELSNWGLTVRNFTRISALENQRKDKKAPLVDSVRPGWPAAETKPPLRADDIITKVAGQPVASVEALQQFSKEFVKGLSEPKPLTVTFERDTQELMTVVKIGPRCRGQTRPPRQSLASASRHKSSRPIWPKRSTSMAKKAFASRS